MKFIVVALVLVSMALIPFRAQAFAPQNGERVDVRALTAMAIDTSDFFEAGATIEVTLVGMPGAQAFVRLDNGPRVPASEVSPGVYKASYLNYSADPASVRQGTGYLETADGRSYARGFALNEMLQASVHQSGVDESLEVSVHQTGDSLEAPAPAALAQASPESTPDLAPLSIPSPLQYHFEEVPAAGSTETPQPTASTQGLVYASPSGYDNKSIEAMRVYYNDPEATPTVEPSVSPVPKPEVSGESIPAPATVAESPSPVAPEVVEPAPVPTVPPGYDLNSAGPPAADPQAVKVPPAPSGYGPNNLPAPAVAPPSTVDPAHSAGRH